MSEDVSDVQRLAKQSALMWMAEALFWLDTTVVEYERFRRLRKAIALDLLDNAALAADERALIERWEVFAPDPMLADIRRRAELFLADEEARKNLGDVHKQMMKDIMETEEGL